MWTPDDTSEDAWRAQHEVWRAMGPEQRLRAALDASDFARHVAASGIRQRHPHYTPEQVRWALYRLLLGDDVFHRAFPGAEALPA